MLPRSECDSSFPGLRVFTEVLRFSILPSPTTSDIEVTYWASPGSWLRVLKGRYRLLPAGTKSRSKGFRVSLDKLLTSFLHHHQHILGGCGVSLLCSIEPPSESTDTKETGHSRAEDCANSQEIGKTNSPWLFTSWISKCLGTVVDTTFGMSSMPWFVFPLESRIILAHTATWRFLWRA